jgi:hypothetical protein
MKSLINLSKVIVIIALLCFVYALFPTAAQAQAVGDTEVRVVVPPVLILYYFSVLEVTLTTNDLIGIAGTYNSVDEGTASVTLNGWTADAAISPTAPNPFTANQTITITNAWGYFGVGNPADQLRATITGSGVASALTLESGTGTIDLSNFQIQSGGVGWAAALQPLPKGGGIRYGDLQFDIDLSNADVAGTYADSGGNTQFSISLEYL